MLSIVVATRNTRDWLELLVRSVRKFTTFPFELIIVENDSKDDTRTWLQEVAQDNLWIVPIYQDVNVGHGRGLDIGIVKARQRYILVLDADTHIMRVNWDYALFDLYRANPNRRMIAAMGTPDADAPGAKPIHACFQFFERSFFLSNGLSFVPREGHDVGRKNYYDVARLGYEVMRIPCGYESQQKKFYPGAYGDIYYIETKPTFYHHWYSSRFYLRNEVDGYKKADFERNKKHLFSMPLVQEILSTGL